MNGKDFYLCSDAHQLCNKAIFITGSGRSGTSLVGSIIHTLENVEYAYEPPTIGAMLSLINDMNPNDWKAIYETYVYEEILLNSIAGRYINCNKNDYSSIYKVKSLDEIESRLSSKNERSQIRLLAQSFVPAFKVPDMTYSVKTLTQYYPEMHIIFVLRGAVETLSSIIEKKWFDPEFDSEELIYPYKKFGKMRVPHFVKEGDEEDWVNMSEIDRAGYYYIQVNDGAFDVDNRIEVKYSNLLANPEKEVHSLSNKLGLKYGPKTADLISSIQDSGSFRDDDLLKKLRPSFREKVEFYSALS